MTYELLDQSGRMVTDADKVQWFDFMLPDEFYGADENVVRDELSKRGYVIKEKNQLAR